MNITHLPGYTVSEFETMAGIPKKDGYRMVKENRVRRYRDSEGRMRISPFEAYHYMRNQEEK